ncbi:MAG: glycosyltransferase family 2 protein [Aquihabitans sp.]
MITLFWASSAVLVHTYVGFPVTVLARARLHPRPHHEAPVTPIVSVIIAAHDEAAVIGNKVRSVLESDYPADALEVIVVSDGSSDATVEQTLAIGDPRVRLIALDRVGKAIALNSGIRAATGEVLVFSDANSHFDRSTLRSLMRPFADPTVGGVAGDQRYLPAGVDPEATMQGERWYWDFDRTLKRAESSSGNVVSATGALYAVRRDLVSSVPDGVTDDFYQSTGVIARGRRLVFAPDAFVHEPLAGSADAEFRRKVRVMTRGLQAVARRRVLLDPSRHGFYAYQLFNHKVLRRLMALPLATLFMASIGCRDRGAFYRLALASQLVIYGTGVAALVRPTGRVARSRPGAAAGYFCLVNAAGMTAAHHTLTGRKIVSWVPEREEDAKRSDGGTTAATIGPATFAEPRRAAVS